MGERYDLLDPDTDYARACRVNPPIGLIGAGAEKALVLAGNPPMSAWARSTSMEELNVFILKAWKTSNPDSLVAAALAQLEPEKMGETSLALKIGKGGLLLMFAGDVPESPVYGSVEIHATPGTYRISVGQYEGEYGSLEIVHLARQ